MLPQLNLESVCRTFGGVLIGTRRRLIPSPTTHLPSSSGRTSTRRTRRSPSLGSVFTPPIRLVQSVRDRPASSSLIPHPIQSVQSLRPLDSP
ncbi:hypothetical protein CROQUDRAFT_660404 [Cronartium quercuum f. sp. fusiforme G11]|uniref:Uncharacterized protein n=1 Tax=Cronartium quercuum f. sp. fusiforme G11 TaxID=708437 RepID=A0A9P6T9X0_9BASI|nr:hypothetical protein CROQUDRAFT_660404 [Cronartium quercuum f. sp. fusiforme G11]